MAIYWQRRIKLNGMLISAIRSTQELHYSAKGNVNAEIMVHYNQGLSEELWAGPAALVNDVLEWIIENLTTSATIDEIVEEILKNPRKYGYYGD